MSAPAERHQPSISTAGYTDGLGRRSLRFDREVGGMLQALELRPEFSLYETLLREAAAQLAKIRDARVASIHAIERTGLNLVISSPLVSGDRLEELLETRSGDEYAGPGIDAALGFLVRALPAVSVLHRAGIVHGIIAPGRLALTASGNIVLLDCIYAAAVERVRLSRERLWTSFGLAAGLTPGGTRFDRAGDLRQVALTAVAIALGRPLQEPCTPQVTARLLQDVTEIAQIHAGDRFGTDLRSLLEAALNVDGRTPATVDETAVAAERLARTLGLEACVTALLGLAGGRVTISDAAPSLLSAAPPPLHLVRHEPARVPQEPEADRFEDLEDLEEPVAEEPQLSLEVNGAVEISLDDPDAVDLDEADEPSVLVLDASDAESALFDWQPDTIAIPRRHEQPEPAALDFAPEPAFALVEPADETPAFGVAPFEPPAPVAPPVAAPVVEAPAVHAQSEIEEATAAAAAPQQPPAPPPGIPLFRPAAQAPAPAQAAPAAPRPAEDTGGLKLYVPPPPPPVPPAPVAYAPPAPPPPGAQPNFGSPVPPSVVVIAPAAVPQVTLRLKEDPVPQPRPRRMLEAAEDTGGDSRYAEPFDTPSRRAPWKLIAAAVVLLGIGAYAGMPFPTSGSDPAAAEAAPAEPAPAPAPKKTGGGGGLHIETQPSGAAVLLNGEDVGRTPLELEDVKPGRHTLTLSTDSTTVKRTVRIEAGKVVTLDIPVYSGWVAIYSPVPLHISEGSRMLGTTETTRVMLSPGRHELTLTNRELGYSAKQTVEIIAGEERVLNIEPKGSVSLNALPWAEVYVDGTRLGETPLANVEVPLGTREFVFKHPTHGERRITTTITSKSAPLSVDFTRPGTRP